MNLENIYHMDKDKLTIQMEHNFDRAYCMLDIMCYLYQIESNKKLKYFNESKELIERLNNYLDKYYKKFEISFLERLENKKFLQGFPENVKEKSREGYFKINLEYLSKRLSEHHKCEVKIK